MARTLEPTAKRFTRREYYRLDDSGVFEDQRVELIDGEIISIPPIGNPHFVALGLGETLFRNAFGPDYWVRSQGPLSVQPASEPQPDLAIVKGKPRDFTDHPGNALLVVEISESTLMHDQTVKMSLYARNEVQDYWIVNLLDHCLEVYRQPVADKSRRFGFRYASVTTLQPRERIAPLALPRKKILVADLLP